jgi:hypothetical protein
MAEVNTRVIYGDDVIKKSSERFVPSHPTLTLNQIHPKYFSKGLHYRFHDFLE